MKIYLTLIIDSYKKEALHTIIINLLNKKVAFTCLQQRKIKEKKKILPRLCLITHILLNPIVFSIGLMFINSLNTFTLFAFIEHSHLSFKLKYKNTFFRISIITL